jgi:hypothetical protein
MLWLGIATRKPRSEANEANRIVCAWMKNQDIGGDLIRLGKCANEANSFCTDGQISRPTMQIGANDVMTSWERCSIAGVLDWKGLFFHKEPNMHRLRRAFG